MSIKDIELALLNSGYELAEFDVGYKGGRRGTTITGTEFAYCDEYCNVLVAHDKADGIALEVFNTVGRDGQQLVKPEGCIVQIGDARTRYALAMYLLNSIEIR